MRETVLRSLPSFCVLIATLFMTGPCVWAQDTDTKPVSTKASEEVASTKNVLDAATATQLDRAVEKALAWLASQQNRDGSFPTRPVRQPGVTSLCALAFMSNGHLPGEGKYGEQLRQALEYVIETQNTDGMFCLVEPGKKLVWGEATHTAMYNHPIAGLMLTECYGMIGATDFPKLGQAIEKGIEFTVKMQRGAEPFAAEDGGWRYVLPMNSDFQGEADLSVTGWHLMFLRSAKNAGFDVPTECISRGADYVQRCYSAEHRQFFYGVIKGDRRVNRGMTGAGILSMSLAGKHGSKEATEAAAWVLEHPVRRYGESVGHGDRFHYGVFYSSHAMYQMGGKFWRGYYPPLVNTFLARQTRSGAWPIAGPYTKPGANVYSTALSVLALTPPNDLLPVYQR